MVLWVGVTGLLLPLLSCANSPFGGAVQRSLSPDARLQQEQGSPSPSPTLQPSPVDAAPLPPDFPQELPIYPNATLLEVEPGTTATPTRTRWQAAAPFEQVAAFYQDAFRSGGWAVAEAASPATPGSPALAPAPVVVEREGVRVGFAPGTNAAIAPPGTTEFVLTYQQVGNAPAAELTPSPGAIASPEPSPALTNSAQSFSDVDQAPVELRRYITDLAQLGVLPLKPPTDSFKPNSIVTRREYARWLMATNNAVFGDRPAQKIRSGVSSDQPVFKDVPTTDPDFAAIQGLAEAGLIPSPLSGDAAAVTFRPDAPLSRETLILWKAPIDVRQSLPSATVQSIQQTWGFQDAARIDPRALRAIQADYQNGDLSNIRRAFGFTTLFQPKQSVTRAEAAAVLWFFGSQGDGLSAQDVLKGQDSSQ